MTLPRRPACLYCGRPIPVRIAANALSRGQSPRFDCAQHRKMFGQRRRRLAAQGLTGAALDARLAEMAAQTPQEAPAKTGGPSIDPTAENGTTGQISPKKPQPAAPVATDSPNSTVAGSVARRLLDAIDAALD